MNRLPRFVRVHINQVEGTAEVHVQRVGLDGHAQVGRYMLHKGEPSCDRLGRLLCGRKKTHYTGQKGRTYWPTWDTYTFLRDERNR